MKQVSSEYVKKFFLRRPISSDRVLPYAIRRAFWIWDREDLLVEIEALEDYLRDEAERLGINESHVLMVQPVDHPGDLLLQGIADQIAACGLLRELLGA